VKGKVEVSRKTWSEEELAAFAAPLEADSEEEGARAESRAQESRRRRIQDKGTAREGPRTTTTPLMG
jgi:hypothetical protein